jgi:hypothetical protein
LTKSVIVSEGATLKLTNIILVPPLETNSQVVGVKYPSLEECKKLFRLLGIQLVDILGEWTHGVYALPSGDRVCAHDRMNRGKVVSNILWCATRTLVYNDMFGISCSSFQKSIADKGRCQALEELAVWLGKSERYVSAQMLTIDLLRSLTDHTTHSLMPIAYRHRSLATS